MKSKTIKKELRKKINNWLESITDEEVKVKVKKNVIVTGGCIASMLLKEKVNDYDLYFKDSETVYQLMKYYIKEFTKFNPGYDIQIIKDTDDKFYTTRLKIRVQSEGVALDSSYISETETLVNLDTLEHKSSDTKSAVKYKPIHLSANAITLSNKIQLIIRFWGSIETIHENYDFVHCTNSYDYDTNKLTLHADALECLLTRELRYIGSKYPLCSIIRTRKFIARQWTINAGQYLKMCLQLNALDLYDLNILEDQLTGVDAIYFMYAIDSIKKQICKNPDFIITEPYLFEIIDKIF